MKSETKWWAWIIWYATNCYIGVTPKCSIRYLWRLKNLQYVNKTRKSDIFNYSILWNNYQFIKKQLIYLKGLLKRISPS